jgi:DNA anti-recombination protein RmuC
LEGKEQNRKQAELLHKELQKSATSHQQMLSEMFLVIDSKIEELTTQVNQKIEALEKKIETDMRESAANHERNMQELEARCLASSKKAAGLLETRVAHLERKSSNDRADLSEVFAGGLSSMVDRLKALRDS